MIGSFLHKVLKNRAAFTLWVRTPFIHNPEDEGGRRLRNSDRNYPTTRGKGPDVLLCRYKKKFATHEIFQRCVISTGSNDSLLALHGPIFRHAVLSLSLVTRVAKV